MIGHGQGDATTDFWVDESESWIVHIAHDPQ